MLNEHNVARSLKPISYSLYCSKWFFFMHFDRIIVTLVNPKALKHWKRFKKHYRTRVKRKKQKPFNAQ